MSERTISDFLVAAANPEDDRRKLESELRGTCRQYVWGQYSKPPEDIRFDTFDILITSDLEAVTAFKLGHECEDCVKGKRMAERLVQAGGTVALVNMVYTELRPAD